MRQLIIIFLCLLALPGSAQGTRASARIQSVVSEGFYRALITTSTSPYLYQQAVNVRIYDSKHQEVPYVYEVAVPHRFSTTLHEYQVLEKKQVPSCCTEWVLSNPNRQSINNISLLIRNAEVSKKLTLLGSDDRKSWYALRNQFIISSVSSTTETSEVKVVDFPLSNYLFYSLQINDSVTAPLNILKAGYYDVTEERGEYVTVPVKTISSTDSATQKQSFIRITFDASYWIDRVDVTMQGQPYFLRNGTLFELDQRTNRKGQLESFFRSLVGFQLSSTHATQLEFETQNKEFLLVIDNKDNPPLELKGVKALQLNRYITAWLRKDEVYTMEFGDGSWTAPQYDIANFKDNIPDGPPSMILEPVRVFEALPAESFTFFSTKNYIWGAMGVVVVLLGIMSVNMIRSIGKK